MQLIITL